MAGERFAAFFVLNMPKFLPQPTRRKEREFLLLFLVLGRVLPLHGASSSRRRMRTEATPTSLLFSFFLWQRLISIYEKKIPKKSGVKLSLSPR